MTNTRLTEIADKLKSFRLADKSKKEEKDRYLNEHKAEIDEILMQNFTRLIEDVEGKTVYALPKIVVKEYILSSIKQLKDYEKIVLINNYGLDRSYPFYQSGNYSYQNEESILFGARLRWYNNSDVRLRALKKECKDSKDIYTNVDKELLNAFEPLFDVGIFTRECYERVFKNFGNYDSWDLQRVLAKEEHSLTNPDYGDFDD